MADTPPVIRHIEAHLGRIDPAVGTWRWRRRGRSTLQAAFRDRPRPGAVTVCSLGVGHHALCSTRGHVRQELLLACWGRFLSAELAGLLTAAAGYALEPHVALSPGQVLGPAGPLIPGSGLEALLCLEPRLHPATLAVCAATEPPTEFVWLVPVTPAEGREAAEGFVSELLARWERDRVDLLDWQRAGRNAAADRPRD
jgi:hypothetical protein